MALRAAHTAAAATLLAATVLLTACAGSPAETETPPSNEQPTPTEQAPEPTETTPAAVFRMPETCADAVPAARIATFEALGMQLLAGPDGLYGDDYLADKTPEQLAGGITCIWGQEDRLDNSVMISVAPVSAATRAPIVDGLVAQALNIVEDGDLVVYARIGDPVAAPAIVNLLRPTSWISVMPGLGGEEQYELAVEIADEVSAQTGAR